jgi:hypothetical protein
MASPEALLLRHRRYTTNICKKVTRSPFRRLFKIGHSPSIFCYFSHLHSAVLAPYDRRTNRLQNDMLSEKCAIVHDMAIPVMCRLRARLRVRILTPGQQKGGRVARYFLLSLAFNSSCENRATGVQSRLTNCGSYSKESLAWRTVLYRKK